MQNLRTFLSSKNNDQLLVEHTNGKELIDAITRGDIAASRRLPLPGYC